MKRGDHLKAARMLIRVSNNISKFPTRKSHLKNVELNLSRLIMVLLVQMWFPSSPQPSSNVSVLA